MERRHRPWWTSRFFLVLAAISLIVGLVLMGLNLYGLTQPIRKPGLGVTDVDQLRFVPDEVWSYEESMEAIARLDVSNLARPEKSNERSLAASCSEKESEALWKSYQTS